MSRGKRITLGVVALLIGAVWWFHFSKFGWAESLKPQEDLTLSGGALGEAENLAGGGKLISRSAFLMGYGAEEKSLRDDLEAVLGLLTDSQLMFKHFDSFFLPDNQAITSFLSGKNPENLIWIPSSHFAVGDEGKLEDRYGTPLFFHRSSALKFELRSAGEDRKMWTEDDVVSPESFQQGKRN